MIREARPKDIPAICALGRESLEVNDPYETLRISDKKIAATTLEVVSGPAHFAWVHENEDGEVDAAVCAITHEIMFHERKQASVLLFYSRNPGRGAGGLLIKKLVEWWKSRRGIKMLVFTLEHGTDPKISSYLKKLGLDKELPTILGVK